ncbi:unnamed protein product [Gongylonema pulchrum]|uniref:Protein kinase domain-containing protein n=1 Tax=Gongylonema pulchrum TaxID=637853 RepID=A0A183EBF3_9BILA|nr:unnamed protein product [Gongylonema pulchrum]
MRIHSMSRITMARGTHYAFGCGKLFLVDGKEYHLEGQPLNEGRTLVSGVEKGIRFIERSGGSIIPALVVDRKAFFITFGLKKLVLVNSDQKWRGRLIPRLTRSLFFEFVHKISDLIRDFRLEHLSCSNRAFLASGLSDIPTADIRGDWPAVRLVKKGVTTYFPIEILRVAPCQRVPLNKQTPTQMKNAIKSVHYNPFMAAFGVRISSASLTVSQNFSKFSDYYKAVRSVIMKLQFVRGHRRAAPKIKYSDMQDKHAIIDIDAENVGCKDLVFFKKPNCLRNCLVVAGELANVGKGVFDWSSAAVLVHYLGRAEGRKNDYVSRSSKCVGIVFWCGHLLATENLVALIK